MSRYYSPNAFVFGLGLTVPKAWLGKPTAKYPLDNSVIIDYYEMDEAGVLGQPVSEKAYSAATSKDPLLTLVFRNEESLDIVINHLKNLKEAFALMRKKNES